MTDFTKECWNCHSQNIRILPTHTICLDCRATYVPMVAYNKISDEPTPGQKETRRRARQDLAQERHDNRYLGKSGSLTHIKEDIPPYL